jgi:hypothetical protein
MTSMTNHKSKPILVAAIVAGVAVVAASPVFAQSKSKKSQAQAQAQSSQIAGAQDECWLATDDRGFGYRTSCSTPRAIRMSQVQGQTGPFVNPAQAQASAAQAQARPTAPAAAQPANPPVLAQASAQPPAQAQSASQPQARAPSGAQRQAQSQEQCWLMVDDHRGHGYQTSCDTPRARPMRTHVNVANQEATPGQALAQAPAGQATPAQQPSAPQRQAKSQARVQQ